MRAVTLRRIGSWAFVVVGIGHLVTQFTVPDSPERARVTASMRAFAIDLPGRAGTLYEYHLGFSMMMGILLLAYGVRTLLSLQRRHLDPAEEVRVLAFDSLVAAVAVGVSAGHFFAVPLALTSLALAAFTGALVLTWREARWRGHPAPITLVNPRQKS